MATGKVFGVDLELLVTQQKADIPKIVSHTLEYLHNCKGNGIILFEGV